MDINIALIEPEIPQNTGNIARTCAAVGASLHLVKPLGFEIDDKKLKRAGLDYWDKLDITYYDGLDDFLEKNREEKMFFFTTKAKQSYTDVKYPGRVFIVFGKETKGLPEELLYAHPERCLKIPMIEQARSLNLANSAAIILYEALRQNGFPGLLKKGQLHRLSWKE